ncbi:MAG: Hsp20/alpha crystallin family protein [Phycisphaerae bacterium]|nr:Hsp20/alpha crystallin family protein [Phycisphaerae bacterium]
MVDSAVAKKTTEAEVAQAERTRSGRAYRPNVDIIENKEELLVVADMPGVNSNSIDVKFENGSLEIHGRVPVRQTPETRYLLREYGVGDFYRSFQVSEAIDASRITAEYADGVLTLHLPKVEAVKPRKIAIKML